MKFVERKFTDEELAEIIHYLPDIHSVRLPPGEGKAYPLQAPPPWCPYCGHDMHVHVVTAFPVGIFLPAELDCTACSTCHLEMYIDEDAA